MALSILDGNQTATTLSTILSSGQHITAHTVVSLGTQAKTDILSAISSGIAISGTVTANTRNNGILNDPWVYIPRLTMSHPDVGNIILDGYYRFDGNNAWGPPNINANYPYLLRIDNRASGDQWLFKLNFYDDVNDQTIELANTASSSPDFPTSMSASGGTLVSGSLTFNTEQRESYGVRVTNSVTVGNTVTIAGTVTIGAGTAQIGSVTASISNSAVTVYPAQGASVSNTTITSLTSSTTLVSAVAGREVLTVFNEGAGNLHISPGATCTTISYQVRLSAGDYWECPAGQLSLAHTAVFATAGTARITQVS